MTAVGVVVEPILEAGNQGRQENLIPLCMGRMAMTVVPLRGEETLTLSSKI